MMTIPPIAFAQPTWEQIAGNADYWTGYQQGRAAAGIVPSPAGSFDFEAYRATVARYLEPTTHAGWVNGFAVGYNSALTDARNYLWINDPDSPHNRAS